MTDLEITRLCAAAMGLDVGSARNPTGPDTYDNFLVVKSFGYPKYDPLQDDAQAMALVKKFELRTAKAANGGRWIAATKGELPCMNADLNRAICECVAKMRAAK